MSLADVFDDMKYPYYQNQQQKFRWFNWNWTIIPILTLLPNFGGFHRTLQRVRLANRGRLLLRTPGPVPFGTCICSNVETILSWTCHVYGPFEFRTSLGTSILLSTTQIFPEMQDFNYYPLYIFKQLINVFYFYCSIKLSSFSFVRYFLNMLNRHSKYIRSMSSRKFEECLAKAGEHTPET